MYKALYRSVLVRSDAELAHSASFSLLNLLDSLSGGGDLIGSLFGVRPKPATVMGLTFPNRLGLAAGFDKNGVGVRAMSRLGFGHIEVGTVTAEGQPGNPKKRLFRLAQSEGVLNRMGFNNDGSERAERNLQRARQQIAELPEDRRPIIGVNIGKTKTVPLEQAADDYRVSASRLAKYADYLAINVSSPNTPGLRDLQTVEALRPILTAVLEETRAVDSSDVRSTLGHVPVLVKIAPDLADDDVSAVCDLASEVGLDGIICTNTVLDRSVLTGADRELAEAEAGGISGAPAAARSFEVLRLVRSRVAEDMTVISVGGVQSRADYLARIAAGADLVQVYTGLIYEGPRLAQKILGR